MFSKPLQHSKKTPTKTKSHNPYMQFITDMVNDIQGAMQTNTPNNNSSSDHNHYGSTTLGNTENGSD